MIGKWNRSVIVTYAGMLLAVASMILLMSDLYKAAMLCFMGAGICDLFDGTIARMCKRTEEEKNFGIQLDSLVDVVSFIALPVVLMIKVCGVKWYSVIACALYVLFGVCRLAYFNVCQEENEDKEVFDTDAVSAFSESASDTSMKLNGVEDGVRSYSRMVNLLLDYYFPPEE